MNVRWIAAATLALAAPWAGATCYTVYAPNGELVYRSSVSPVDLSQPLSRGLAARFPNHQLVMVDDDLNCVDVGTVRDADRASSKPMDATGLLAQRAPDMIGTSDRGRSPTGSATAGLVTPGVPSAPHANAAPAPAKTR
ncbi:MAG TPA: hypothetical protein VMU47_02945 [Caldimonas sp.]|nr:hypothetical protein [Caldimonas sp.]